MWSLKEMTQVTERLPEVREEDGWKLTSGPLLVYREKWKTFCVARYESCDLDFPEFRWLTDDSEGWDITREVSHWHPLPVTEV